MERETNPAYLYVEGLRAITKSHKVGLEEAYRLAREDSIHGFGEEHLPYIDAAYKHLKSLEKTKK